MSSEHDEIEKLIKDGEAVIDKKGSGKVGRIKFKDNEIFNYNKDKPISIKLKDYLKQIKKNTSEGVKKYKQKVIDHVKNNFDDMVKDIDRIIDRDFVLEKLIKNNIVLNKDIHDLPHEANQFIKNKITKHNNQHMMDEIKDEFDKLNKGKYKYSLSFQVRVRNNVGDKVVYNNEDRSGEFKHDDIITWDAEENKYNGILKSKIMYIINLYYTWKDYSVIDEVLKHKITKMNSKANIKTMDLWYIGFGRIFYNKLFKYSRDKITNWDEKASKDNYKQCVIVFLITTYHILIEKGLVNKKVLTEEYINNYFKNKGGFNVNNLIEFIKDLKYASICIFDCLGIVPIIAYSVNDAVINGDFKPNEFIDENNQMNPKWYKKGVGVLTENHIEGLFNDNEIQSITKNGSIKAFTNHITNDDDFEFFDDIERK